MPQGSQEPFPVLDDELNEQKGVHFDPIPLPQDIFKDKNIAVIGGGVGGLTAAYECLLSGKTGRVVVFEARDRVGGRVLSLRNGDVVKEDATTDLYSTPGTTQTVCFEKPEGDEQVPYLNAGAGRIPSSHKHLLGYLHKFELPLQVYVMDSESNLAHIDDSRFKGEKIVNRRLIHNTRGRMAELIYHNAEHLKDPNNPERKYSPEDIQLLKSLMLTFGELDDDGYYGREKVTTRAGFLKLPGVFQGKAADPFSLGSLLHSQYWRRTRVFQPDDFLWQPTMFEPVEGMDRVPHIFADNVIEEGGEVKLETPVVRINYHATRNAGKFEVVYSEEGEEKKFYADYVFCNVAMPFLEKMVADELQSLSTDSGFEPQFKKALHAVYKTQRNPTELDRFLAYTTKVGWYARRDLWQGAWMDRPFPSEHKGDGSAPAQTTVGVVPIYGGISWTDHEIQQIWYPSSAFHDEMGILTGCYNFTEYAQQFGEMTPDQRLGKAIEGAKEFSKEFAAGLKKEYGVSIAWQKIPYIKGGWAQWENVGDAEAKQRSGNHYADHYNAIVQGTTVNGEAVPTFFVVGDQASQLAGWQEGAVLSALQAISRIADPAIPVPYVQSLGSVVASVHGGYTVNRQTML